MSNGKLKINEKEFDSRKHIKEFKRKCKQCGKIWHSLESREKQIKSNFNVNNLNVISNCCNPSAQLQAKRNSEANQSDLDKLKQCPNCSSHNYSEEVIIYEKE
ncbi:MAG: hypothetical protein AABW52_05865 [Nanoarchaeota archaeon]